MEYLRPKPEDLSSDPRALTAQGGDVSPSPARQGDGRRDRESFSVCARTEHPISNKVDGGDRDPRLSSDLLRHTQTPAKTHTLTYTFTHTNTMVKH